MELPYTCPTRTPVRTRAPQDRAASANARVARSGSTVAAPGTTKAYTLVNGGFGVRWSQNRVTTSVKVINLANQDVQQHVFGDILKRQVVGEMRVRF